MAMPTPPAPRVDDQTATPPAVAADIAAPAAYTGAYDASEWSGDTRARLQSAIVLLLMAGLFMALPFVLSIGAVVFLPPVTAVVITIMLAPLADRLTRLGLPSMLASFIAILTMTAVIVAALALILQPAFNMVDQVPDMLNVVSRRFAELRGNFAWISDFNRQLARLTGHSAREVVLAGPSVIEQVAFATPSVVLETLLTLLMTFFMVETRIRVKRRLALDRQNLSASVRLARVMRDVQDRVAGYLLTVAQVNLGVGVIVAGGASLYGLSAPIMWGGLAFVFNFLPYLGPLAMTALLALVGLGTASSVPLGLLPALAFLALHAVEANFVTPAILGARFTVSPVSILLAISYFSWIWGVLGALLSVPILLTISALLENLGRPNLIGFLLGEPLFRGASTGLAGTPDQPGSG
jgi:predicted PurR-regulated permease PerM